MIETALTVFLVVVGVIVAVAVGALLLIAACFAGCAIGFWMIAKVIGNLDNGAL